MHELSIAQSLLEIVMEESERHKLTKVNTIKLQIGEFASVVPESLTFCFEMVSQNTIAAGSVLEIETVPVVARCLKCDTNFEVENQVFICPQCGEPSLDLLSGRDLSIASIEGETGD
ncbi:MAG: hydrogenase maturation nickel metallochaperone HypA [Acidobacteriota bacterium]